jgi:hypothetical protein
LYQLVDQVERGGSRAWVWSDYAWHHPEVFYQKMPHSVMQSNWYYGDDFGPDVIEARTYAELEAHGYDQIPTGSNWSSDVNFGRTVSYCHEHIAPERLKGFMQSIWKPTLEACRERHMRAIYQVQQARETLN